MMIIAPTGKVSLNLSDREDDNLAAIKGIGSARQRWLQESLGIRTFQDLAALSSAELESRLKAEGKPFSRNEIERWILEARERATAKLPLQRHAKPVAQAGRKPHFTSRKSELSLQTAEGQADSATREHIWEPFASFVVEFQARKVEGQAEEYRTTVHYVEADKGRAWPGIEGEQLHRWMLGQLGKRVLEGREEEPPIGAQGVTIEIGQVRAFQPPQAQTSTTADRGGQPFQGSIRSGELFALGILFTLAGPDAADTAKKQVAYRVQFHARNLATGERTYLGGTRPDTLIGGQLSYSTTLPAVTLQPGKYRIHALATLECAPPVLGYLEVPLLEVV